MNAKKALKQGSSQGTVCSAVCKAFQQQFFKNKDVSGNVFLVTEVLSPFVCIGTLQGVRNLKWDAGKEGEAF